MDTRAWELLTDSEIETMLKLDPSPITLPGNASRSLARRFAAARDRQHQNELDPPEVDEATLIARQRERLAEVAANVGGEVPSTMNTTPFDLSIKEEIPMAAGIKRPVVKIATNEVFPSISAAERAAGCRNNAIFEAIRSGAEVDGSTWTYANAEPSQTEPRTNLVPATKLPDITGRRRKKLEYLERADNGKDFTIEKPIKPTNELKVDPVGSVSRKSKARILFVEVESDDPKVLDAAIAALGALSR